MIDNISNAYMPGSNKLENNINKLSENINNVDRLKEEKALKSACEDFEAIFINMMLKSGRNTVVEGGFIEKSNGTKMFEDMYDQEMSSAMSKSGNGGMGIAKMLYTQMKLGLNQKRAEVEANIVE